ncbi:MAG TPA: hypothetical protein VLD57_01840, partial [Blastocatellia bacterium]|nr:hypothetical protein [Blastocatellia bacterium]
MKKIAAAIPFMAGRRFVRSISTILFLVLMFEAMPVNQRMRADNTAHPAPFDQDWSNTMLIATNNDWSGVPAITGYQGENLVSSAGVDPQTITADGSTTTVNVLANRLNPDTLTTGGVAEFDGIADPTVALQGSGTARAPHIVINLNTTGQTDITISYKLRDIDGSADNAVQPVALQ